MKWLTESSPFRSSTAFRARRCRCNHLCVSLFFNHAQDMAAEMAALLVLTVAVVTVHAGNTEWDYFFLNQAHGFGG